MALALVLAGGMNPAWGEAEKHDGPSHVEAIEGSSLKRVILTERAAERVGILTDVVSGRDISRSHTILGEVMAPPYAEALMAQLGGDDQIPQTIIRTARTIEALTMTLGQEAFVRLTGKSGLSGNLSARLVAIVAADTPDSPDDLFFSVDAAGPDMGPQQQVLVDFTMTELQRRAVQSTALVYDEGGAAWVYVNPEPLVYFRHPIAVDFVHGDWAVLTDGPPDGTMVVTGGAMLLLGTELGIGH